MRNVVKKITGLCFLLSIVIAIGMSFIFVNTISAASSDFMQGEGTEENPYLVSTPAELNKVRYHRDAYFLQTANLDLSEFGEFAPIGSLSFPFTGRYDGGKYSISNISINSTENNVGLFSNVRGGKVLHIKMDGGRINGAYNVGSVVGTNQGEVIGCVTDNVVTGSGSVGAIVGLNAATVKECGNVGTVSCSPNGKYTGGIAGINNGKIENCYNRGDINANERTDCAYSGGIAGKNAGASARIEKSYTTGIIGGKARGQVAGDNLDGAVIGNCIWQQSELNRYAPFEDSLSDNLSIERDAFADVRSFASWLDFNDKWTYFKNQTYPMLRREYVPVASLTFGQASVRLKPGDSYTFSAAVSPAHASTKDVVYSLSGATQDIEYDGDALRVKENAAIGGTVCITATVEGISTTMRIEIVKIPVERIEIINESGKNTISAIERLKFKGVVYPHTASDQSVSYGVSSSYASITSDGVMTVRENAPIGLNITVTATSADSNNLYASAVVTVSEVSVDRVEITCSDSFRVTETLDLTARVLPVNASHKNVTYKIVSSTASGAQIAGDVLFADGLGEIVIRAYAGGVQSGDYSVTVLKEPVTSVTFDLADRMTCGEGVALQATVLPQNATHKNINYSITGGHTNAEIVDGVLYASRDGFVTVRASADGISVDKTIEVKKISVSSVRLNCADSFQYAESLRLNASVTPGNATYKNITYSVINDTADCRIVNGILYAAKPGTVTVKAEADGVSDEKTITALKIPVSNVTLNAGYVEDDAGEALRFSAQIYPKNATYQSIKYYLSSGPATLSSDGYLLIDKNAPVGTLIEVYAVVDGMRSCVYEVRSGKIKVKSLRLSAETSTIRMGEGVALTLTTHPTIVSNPGVVYEIDGGNGEVAGNVLYVNDPEMIGKTLRVTAVVDGVRSNPLSFHVEKNAVQAIGFTCAATFKITDCLELAVRVFPLNAAYAHITYTVVSSGDTGAYIADRYLYAKRPGVIKIRAAADGASRDLIVHALKEPVVSVVLTSVKTVKVFTELYLTSVVSPSNATLKAVRYELRENSTGAEILGGRIFYCEHVGTVTLRVYADDIYRDYVIEVTKEPVVNIVMNGATAFKHTESLALSASVLPRNATYGAITYEIVRGGEFARIEDGRLYAAQPGRVTLRLSADGFSKEFDVQVIKQAVTDIAIDGTDKIKLNGGYRSGEIGLRSIVSPKNATYAAVTYALVGSSDHCTARIEKERLYVDLNTLVFENGYAKEIQATVTVSATADGVTTTRIYHVYKEKVQKITLLKRIEEMPNLWYYTDSTRFKTSGRMYFTVNILSDLASCKDYTIRIDGENVAVTQDNTYSIKKEKPGTIVVSITSLCNEEASCEFVFDVEEEPIAQVFLGTELASSEKKANKVKRGDIPVTANSSSDDASKYADYYEIEVQQSNHIALRAFATAASYDLKATYGHNDYLDLYYEADGISQKFTDGESNLYFSYNGNELVIKEKAPVSKSFYLYAQAPDEYGGKKSFKTKITVQSKYILDIKSAKIDNTGLITGLENLYGGDGSSIVEKVNVKITHARGIKFEKTILTKNPTLRLQLHNVYINGYFDITYTVYFNEEGYKYHYVIPNVKTFDGLRKYPEQQTPEQEHNAVILFDFTEGIPYSKINLGKNIKAVYVKGSMSTMHGFDIDNDVTNCFDMTLEDLHIEARGNDDGIRIRNEGDFRLYIRHSAGIYGGYGNRNQVGRSAIYSPGKVILEGGSSSSTLYAYGGTGGSGESGEHGKQGETGGMNSDGTGKKGGAGGSGGNGSTGATGGSAIRCKILETTIHIDAQGGKGGRGGSGGAGGWGGIGGEGRHGELFVYSANGGDGGDGGRGGNGGNGGRGGDGITAGSIVKIRSVTIEAKGGQGGDAGFAGPAGPGGIGGPGGCYMDSNKGRRPSGNDGVQGPKGNIGNYGSMGNAYTY